MEYNLENDDLEEEQPRVGGYRALGVIFFLLAAGGLFIGLLSSVANLFATKLNVLVPLSSPKKLQGTLFAFIWVVFENLFKGGTGSVTGVVWEYLELVLSFFLVIAVLASLVCMIVALCSKKSAKTCAFASAVVVSIAYLLFAMVTSTIGMNGGKLSLDYFDLPICIVAALCVIILAVAGCAANKGHGVGSIFGFLFAIAAFFAMTYPGSFMSASSLMALEGITKFGKEIYAIVGFALYYLLIVNVIVSTCRFVGKRGYTFDAIRFAVLFLAAVVFFIIAIIQYKDAKYVFLGPKDAGIGWLIANILLLATLLIGFIVFLTIAVRLGIKARRERDDALFEKLDKEKEEKEASAQKSNLAPTYVTNINNAPAPAAPYTAAPAAAPQQAVYPQQAATPNMMFFQSPQNQPAYPYYSQPFIQPVPVVQPIIQSVPRPVVQTVARPQLQHAEDANAENAEPEMSEFERRMLELVRGGAETAPAAEAASEAAPATGTEAAPVAAPAPVEAPAESPAEAKTEESAANYVYDPFFNSLSNAEKDEFGDLFIGKKKGDFGLPVYQIGGDNTAFFKNFFVYLGKFRPYISSAVLGKVYKHING